MPVRAAWAMVCGALLLLQSSAGAQSMSGDQDRFFADPKDDKDKDNDDKGREEKESRYRGSLTSTTFIYRETAPAAQPLMGAVSNAENASPVDRLFTDMRAQLDGKDLSRGSYDVRFDSRVRVTTDGRFQSGTYGGREYEAREIYLQSKGGQTTWKLGRQFVTELAAVKIDGLRIDRRSGENWSYLAFAGLYPARGSRSVLEDYPRRIDPMDPAAEGERILPAAAGLGGAYRFEKYYGSIGVVGIMPRADDATTGTLEKPRAFASAQGYYRRSAELDIYHFIVVDGTGAAGAGLTNLSVGVNYRPSINLRINAAVNRVDTETLNVIAQTKLEDPDPNANALVQNNIEVSRISSESARLGVSGAFSQRRFEVSVLGQIRRRPELVLALNDGVGQVVLGEAQAGEVTMAVTDRRSYKGARIGASVTRIFGLGDANLYRSEATIARLTGSRVIKGGKGEVELDATYIDSADDNRDVICSDLLTCYGTSLSRTITVGALMYYRFDRDWFLIASASAGTQKLTIMDSMTETRQPSIVLTSGFARLAYRF